VAGVQLRVLEPETRCVLHQPGLVEHVEHDRKLLGVHLDPGCDENLAQVLGRARLVAQGRQQQLHRTVGVHQVGHLAPVEHDDQRVVGSLPGTLLEPDQHGLSRRPAGVSGEAGSHGHHPEIRHFLRPQTGPPSQLQPVALTGSTLRISIFMTLVLLSIGGHFTAQRPRPVAGYECRC
jgi:hypothetical protein